MLFEDHILTYKAFSFSLKMLSEFWIKIHRHEQSVWTACENKLLAILKKKTLRLDKECNVFCAGPQLETRAENIECWNF